MKNDTLRFWIAFIAILAFSASASQFVFEAKGYYHIDRKTKNYLELGAIVVTFLLGYIYYYRVTVKAIRFLWLAIYGLGIAFFTLFTIVDNFIYSTSRGSFDQYRFYTTKDILIGPIIFLALYIFMRVIQRTAKNQTPNNN